MRALSLTGGEPRRVLALGCHADDIEIGCGGVLLTLAAAGVELDVTWVVLGAGGARAEEASRSAHDFLEGVERSRVEVEAFRDGFFPYIGGEVKEYFERLKREVDPDVIFTHNGNDRHQDHRLVSELTWNTFRRHLILEYEIPKYDGDLGAPSVFFAVSDEVARRKVELIRRHFSTQGEKHWFDEETFLSLLRLRGMEAGGASRYAEAFYCRKLGLAV